MCGITGLFNLDEKKDPRVDQLEHSLRYIQHRGPDGQQTLHDGPVALGHARLAIIEPGPAGAQPMWDPNGRYALVFNGEVYNDPELRGILSDEGVHPRSSSDTELFLHWLISRGPEGLEQVNGFFAFALWDREERSLVVGRDRYGIKPLFVREEEGTCLFASELNALLAYGIPERIDPFALQAYMQLSYVPAPHSILEGVRKCLPGEWMKWGPEGKGTGQLEQNGEERVWEGSFEDAVEAYRETLLSSVRDRLRSDVPLGCFLSGGIDSGIVTALASQEQKGLPSFSIGYGDPSFDESKEAELTASHLGTEHRTFQVGEEDFVEGAGEVLERMDEPFADSSAIPVFLLSRWSAQHVKTVLSGDGADELFGGYNKHRGEVLARQPGFREKLALWGAPLWKLLPKGKGNGWKEKLRKLDRFAQAASLGPEERYWRWASQIPLERMQEMLRSPCSPRAFGEWREELFRKLAFDRMEDLLRSDRSFVLPNDMLRKLDRMSMASGLEARVPFLDQRAVRLVESFPSEWRIDRKERKILLKRAFGDLLPERVMKRPKQGFEVPLADLLRRTYSRELRRYADFGLLNEQAIFDPGGVERAIGELEAGKSPDNGASVWAFLVFQKWWEKWLA